jgi:ligand-binding sensor domain-containing protein/signal transduction histidine kinase/CheY-like chemotaxis protein/AraC-like DNA-binding protein
MLLIGHVHGQNNLNNFNHITTSNQFSLNSVTAISQDKSGFMWFGTRKGLFRYDGTRLKMIEKDYTDQTFFNSNDINGIHIDSKGLIWVATSAGLSTFNPEKNIIKNFPIDPSDGSSTSSNVITCVQEMNSDEIWIGTDKGLDIYNPGSKTFRHILHNPSLKASLSSNSILSLYQSADATIWVGTENGLNKLLKSPSEDKYQFKVYQHHTDNANSIINNQVNVLQEDKKGNLWVGTSNGLDYLDVATDTFLHFSKKKENSFTNELIRAMTIDWNGRLWVGTYDGINVIDTNSAVEHIKHEPDVPSSLVDNKIRALFTDRNGTVWLGSYYGGINYWDHRQLNFSKIDEGNGRKLSFKVVSAIVEDKEENIYFGTEGEGISILNAKSNKYEYVNTLKNGSTIGSVKTLFLEGEKKLWIGTFNSGLFYLDKATNDCKQYKNDPGNNQSISSDQVLSIAQGEGDKLWIGTLTGGLNLFDPVRETFVRIQSRANDEHSIYGNSVRALHVDQKGDLYVGTSLGLSVLREPHIQVSSYKFDRIKPAGKSIAQLNIHDIYEDRQGQIWVGTQGYGFFQVRNNQLVSVSLKGVTTVYAIVQDEKNVFWLSSNEGIIKYDPEKETLRIYDRKEGVQSNEFVKSSKLYSKSGRIYFGGASGVTSFRPEGLGIINEYAPEVVITGFRLFDKTLEVGDSTGLLHRAIEHTQELTLDYDQNIFTINFAMPNFIETENNLYRYRLKGLEKKWTTTATPSVTYTIQQGGDYVFEVSGENGDGFKTSSTTSLAIEVLSPPWRTWWAYLGYGLVVLGIFIAIVYEYQSRIKLQHKLEMESREFLHQQEVNKQKLQFFTNISHEFRTPLTLISGPLQKLIEDYKGPHKLFRQLLVIKKNTDQLYKLINELLDFRKLENKQIKLQAAEGNIVKFLREIYLSFQQQAKSNKYTYTFETDSEEIKVYFDRDKLEKVFYNLLANAFKYTPPKGTVGVALKCTSSHIEVIVTDNGDGMEAHQINRIFDQFYEIPDQKSYGQFIHGSGIGLAIVKSIVDLHKGEIRVVSEKGAGSSFIVALPLGSQHLLADELIKEFKDSEDISQYAPKQALEAEPSPVLNGEFMAAQDDGKKCVLVVEDNPEVGSFIRSVLTDHYSVVLVENGLFGYKSAIKLQPDLIISDLMMPEMDGIEFCSKVKTDIRTSHIPFILLSARTSLVFKYDGLESGADDYLNKPFEIKELLLKCKNIIHTHERLKEKFSNSGVFAPSDMAVNSLDETMMKKAFQIVHDNISNELFGVEQFSEELGISRSLLFTKFKAWTNQTPNEFILGMRMKQASFLIEKNQYNLSEVGYKVGFKDPSYFSKVFKKHFSLSPKAYSEKFHKDFYVE